MFRRVKGKFVLRDILYVLVLKFFFNIDFRYKIIVFINFLLGELIMLVSVGYIVRI